MATWGNTASTTNLALQNNSVAGGGAAALDNQKLDSVTVRSGAWGASSEDWRVAVYGASALDADGAVLIEDFGVVTVSVSFTNYTINTASSPTAISDYDYLYIAAKTNDQITGCNTRVNSTAASQDMDAYHTGGNNNDETVAWPGTYPNPSTDVNPGALQAHITHSDAPATGIPPARSGANRSAPRSNLGAIVCAPEMVKIDGLWQVKRKPMWLPTYDADVPWPTQIEPKPKYSLLIPVGIDLQGVTQHGR
jgi:hypothetical protein